MGCVTRRRGRWVVDARLHGRRIVTVYGTRLEAQLALKKLEAEEQRQAHPSIDPFITLAEYVPRFLADCEQAEVTR